MAPSGTVGYKQAMRRVAQVVETERPTIAAGDLTLAELKALADAWLTATALPFQA